MSMFSIFGISGIALPFSSRLHPRSDLEATQLHALEFLILKRVGGPETAHVPGRMEQPITRIARGGIAAPIVAHIVGDLGKWHVGIGGNGAPARQNFAADIELDAACLRLTDRTGEKRAWHGHSNILLGQVEVGHGRMRW